MGELNEAVCDPSSSCNDPSISGRRRWCDSHRRSATAYTQTADVANIIGKDVLKANPLMAVANASIIGGVFALCIARTGYVVWRDYDIVRLQKQLIDITGEREANEKAGKVAEAKISEIKAAGLRPPHTEQPKPWE